MECDDSGGGIGVVFMQDRKPIAYFSKALAPSTLTKSVYEKEIMAPSVSSATLETLFDEEAF